MDGYRENIFRSDLIIIFGGASLSGSTDLLSDRKLDQEGDCIVHLVNIFPKRNTL